LSIEEGHYGPDSPELIVTLTNLSNVVEVLGDPQKKRELLERTLIITEKNFDSDQLIVASALTNLADICENLGDAQTQCELLERALQIEETHYSSVVRMGP
jgi:uncharacterized protein YwgA